MIIIYIYFIGVLSAFLFEIFITGPKVIEKFIKENKQFTINEKVINIFTIILMIFAFISAVFWPAIIIYLLIKKYAFNGIRKEEGENNE